MRAVFVLFCFFAVMMMVACGLRERCRLCPIVGDGRRGGCRARLGAIQQ